MLYFIIFILLQIYCWSVIMKGDDPPKGLRWTLFMPFIPIILLAGLLFAEVVSDIYITFKREWKK